MNRKSEKLLDKVITSLGNEFIVLGHTRVRAWHAWLIIGLAAGIVAGILFVANKSGDFETSSAASNTIEIYAQGTTVSNTGPTMKLYINDKNVKTFTNIKAYAKYTYISSSAINKVKIQFTNDAYKAPQDRNLRVDKIIVNGTAYETEASNVFSKDCGGISGYRQTEWLNCNGYFEWSSLSVITPPVIITPTPPTGLTASCSTDEAKATLAWNAVSGATNYHVRIDDTQNNSASCASGWFCSDPPDKLLDNYTPTSYTANITAGQAYKWWVHSVNSAGYSAQTEGTFSCTIPVVIIPSPAKRFFGNTISIDDNLWNDAKYKEKLNIFSQQITGENSAKWKFVETTRGIYDWSKIDRELAWAEANNKLYKAHALLWKQALPDYLNSLPTITERRAEAEKYIRAFVTRYKGRIWAYELVNEPIAEPLESLFGNDYLNYFYGLARNLDPNAKFFINEYNVEFPGQKSDTYYNLALSLKNSGLIDGIGFQGHFLEKVSSQTVAGVIDRFSAIGLPIYITEFDLVFADDNEQLNKYRELLEMFESKPQVKGITLWGFWANAIWRGPSAAILRSDFSERPAAAWIRQDFMPLFSNVSAPSISVDSSLGSIAAQRGFIMGAGASDPEQLNDPKYAEIAAGYNAIEPGNTMKMPAFMPSPGVYSFSEADKIVAFAQAHGQHVTATAPIWFDSVPSWLTNGGYSGTQLQQILHDYIFTIMQHYHDKFPGVVNRWSIVSEATHGKSVWNNIPGDYVTLAYQYARQADPTVKLCYDDYGGEGLGAASDAIYNLVSGLKAKGLIDCVGLEGQWEGNDISAIPSASAIISNINRLGALGLEVYFSQVEVGIRSADRINADNPADLNRQASAYSTLLEACLSTSACKAFYTWGITDKYAFCWNPGWCAPLIYDANYNPKPAFGALKSMLINAPPQPPSTSGSVIPTPTLNNPPQFSFGMFHSAIGTWYLDTGNEIWDGCATDKCLGPFGVNGDTAVAGDWNGDGKTEIGVFRPSDSGWYLDLNGNGLWDGCATDACIKFGASGDLPVTGNWNGGTKTAIGVFRPSTNLWYLDNGNNSLDNCGIDKCLGPFGDSGDRPIVGDWTGDGKIKTGVFRPSTAMWYLDMNGNGLWDGCGVDKCQGPFGVQGDIPVAGDWNGDGKTEFGVFRPSTGIWYIDLNANGQWDGCAVGSGDFCRSFGAVGDMPIIGNWKK